MNHIVKLFLTPAGDTYLCTISNEPLGNGSADAAACSGYECYFPVEFHFLFRLNPLKAAVVSELELSSHQPSYKPI
jgi:hypothetical protein